MSKCFTVSEVVAWCQRCGGVTELREASRSVLAGAPHDNDDVAHWGYFSSSIQAQQGGVPREIGIQIVPGPRK